MILNKQQQIERQLLDDRIRDLAFKKNITFAEAKKIIEARQSSLSDFRIR